MQDGKLPLATWFREGLRAGFLLRPRVGPQQPTPGQLLAIVALLTAVELALGRLEVAGDALFDVRGWLAPWWNAAALLFIAWWVLPHREEGPRGLAAWFALWAVAILPANVVSQALGIANAHDALPGWLTTSEAAGWAIYVGLWAWSLAVVWRIAVAFAVPPRRTLAQVAAVVAVFAVTAWQFPDRAWKQDPSEFAHEPRERLALSQDTFEAQQALWRQAVERLAPQRAGTRDVYGLVFAPYAREDVFLRESTMVAQLLADRFDAQARVLHLVNHASTAQSLPWATPLNLKRAVDALAQRMDRDEDVLVVYMTSHGANDFRLAAAHPPLDVGPISPGELREALDNAGVKHRVIAISACYSGGWVGPLASADTLVMTAADATHTSYGCGRLSELTFFGRAVFDEQLRRTHSFEQAFAAAVPVIRRREEEAGKDDGFSNPQLSAGERIRPVLREIEERLAAQERR